MKGKSLSPSCLSRRTSGSLPQALALAALLPGCSAGLPAGQPSFDPTALVPAGGVVTLNGAPLARAVVTFLPRTGAPGVGETDAEGKYTLKSATFRGVAPGDYKVSISYMLSPDGEPQGQDARDALVKTTAVMRAREALPPKYSDLGRTLLVVHVGSQGGSAFNFDVKAEVPAAAAKAQAADDEARPG